MSKKTDPTRPTDLGGTCFCVSAETLSLESPFPRLRNLLPKRVHPHVANCAAGGTVPRKYKKIVSEKCPCYTRKFLKKMDCAKNEANCQRL